MWNNYKERAWIKTEIKLLQKNMSVKKNILFRFFKTKLELITIQ